MLKLLVKLGALILGREYSNDEPRADMYLPVWILAFAVILFVLGIGVGIYAVVAFSVAAFVGALCSLVLGAAALLCWKNQTIRMLPNDAFEYTTFLGNKKVYRFSQIKGLRRNRDSLTLLVGEGKVHIEASAILTERLVQRIDQALMQVYGHAE